MRHLKRGILPTGSGMFLAAFMAFHSGPGTAGKAGDGNVTGDKPADRSEAAMPASASEAVQGLRVYRDPRTGQLGAPPPDAVPLVLTPAEQRMLNRSDQGLHSYTLPGGGVAIDLQGRYRSMAIVNVGADGQASVHCQDTPDGATDVLHASEQPVRRPAD